MRPRLSDEGSGGASAGTRRFGMFLFLVSLSVLFAASMAGYLVVRLRAPEWPPPGSPPLPAGLWASTIVLLASSGTMRWAEKAVREDRGDALRRALLLTLLLGVAFLVLQILNWSAMGSPPKEGGSALYGFTFYMLTGLHAAHVLGGIGALSLVTAKARRGAYSSRNRSGVDSCAMYWHFLDVVWIILFVVLLIGSI
jgi:cytochrome c oxidase subunit 3